MCPKGRELADVESLDRRYLLGRELILSDHALRVLDELPPDRVVHPHPVQQLIQLEGLGGRMAIVQVRIAALHSIVLLSTACYLRVCKTIRRRRSRGARSAG